MQLFVQRVESYKRSYLLIYLLVACEKCAISVMFNCDFITVKC